MSRKTMKASPSRNDLAECERLLSNEQAQASQPCHVDAAVVEVGLMDDISEKVRRRPVLNRILRVFRTDLPRREADFGCYGSKSSSQSRVLGEDHVQDESRRRQKQHSLTMLGVAMRILIALPCVTLMIL
jgi:hypothetical protein